MTEETNCTACGHPADVHGGGECWIRHTSDGGWEWTTETPTDCDCTAVETTETCARCGHPAARHWANTCWSSGRAEGGPTAKRPSCPCDHPVSSSLMHRREALAARAAGVATLAAVADDCCAQLDSAMTNTARRVVRVRAVQTIRELHRRRYTRCAECEGAGRRGRWHHETEPCPQQEPAGDSVRT